MSINILYNKIYCGETVQIECTRTTYETVRTGLIKKYQNTAKLMDSIGDDSLMDSYVQASYDKATGVATFAIKPLSAKKRKSISYKLL